MTRWLTALWLLTALAVAGDKPWNAAGEDIEGATLRAPGKLLTWGKRLIEWDLATGKHTVLAKGPFTSGGCWTGASLAVGEPSGRLELRRPPHWLPEPIDNGVQIGDCLWTQLLGHEGLLMIQRGAQIRLYEPPGKDDPHPVRWPYREIYSIYTPSYQGGLIVSDINKDGRPDLYCGNYWLPSPESFDLPWHLFAINELHKGPRASDFRLVLTPEGLMAAQGDLEEQAHISLFTPAGDRKQEWTERPLAPGFGIKRPKAVAYDGTLLFVGENAGPDSRVFTLDRKSDWKAVELGRTGGVHSAFAIGNGEFVAVGRDKIYRFRANR